MSLQNVAWVRASLLRRRTCPALVGIICVLLSPASDCAARGADLASLEQQAVKAAVDLVAPSVVRIETVGGLERVGEVSLGRGPTTGLIVSDDGYVVSSAFNFAQRPDSILVTLADGTRSVAKLVATDHSRMIVLLKISTDAELPVPEVLPAAKMRVGQWTIAVGRAFEGNRPNASVGILSARDRIWGKAVQTDAKISPSNYGGPLIDIAGRVLGILVPISPGSTEEVAGVEWYDSGIGFAIPLEHIQQVLPRLKEGKDLYPGVLGISLEGADIFSLPAIVGACRGGSPAYQAGFRAGDKIVEAGGQPILRQAQLKHQLGSRYAGDTLKLVALRGEERIEREVELVEKLLPYEFPFLGLLPQRSTKPDQAALMVRYVYPDSPAAKAGLAAGDRVESINGEVVKGRDSVIDKLSPLAPDATIKLTFRRDDKPREVEIQLGRLPEEIPGELPPSRGPLEGAADQPPVGVVSCKLPDVPNECVAYVPPTYHPSVPHGVIVWLGPPGGMKDDELFSVWKEECSKRDLILLAPKPADPKRWQPTEVRFVRRVLDDLVKKYTVDRSRVVAHGHEAGGAMAYLVALSNRDLFRGIAAIDAPLPSMLRPRETDPMYPMAIYTTTASKAAFSPQLEAGIKRLRMMKYPVTTVSVGEQGRYLNAAELAGLARWVDALDRM